MKLRIVTRTRRAVLAVLGAAVLLSALTGCTTPEEPRPGSPTATHDTERNRREPTAADLDDLRAQIRALPKVATVDLGYDPDTFENSASWSGTVSVDSSDHQLQVETLRSALRVLWTATDLASGDYRLVVATPDGAKIGGYELGYSATVTYEDMEELFGPRPTPTPSS